MESSNAASSAPESAALSESSENLSESQSLESGQSLESQEASIDANPNLSKAEKAAAKKTLKKSSH